MKLHTTICFSSIQLSHPYTITFLDCDLKGLKLQEIHSLQTKKYMKEKKNKTLHNFASTRVSVSYQSCFTVPNSFRISTAVGEAAEPGACDAGGDDDVAAAEAAVVVLAPGAAAE